MKKRKVNEGTSGTKDVTDEDEQEDENDWLRNASRHTTSCNRPVRAPGLHVSASMKRMVFSLQIAIREQANDCRMHRV
jgi:hypothetical protein